MSSQIEYVNDDELVKQRCPCGRHHERDEYEQLPCRWNGYIVERFYRCPRGEIVSWCKRGPGGVTFGKL
jgi:hypothetical protein